jgi:hypothetical protein
MFVKCCRLGKEVEHLSHHPKVKGLSPAVAGDTGRENGVKNRLRCVVAIFDDFVQKALSQLGQVHCKNNLKIL